MFNSNVTASVTTMMAAHLARVDLARWGWIIALVLWMTGLLCVLNVALAIAFRKRSKIEVASYYAVFVLELAIFVVMLLFYLGVFTTLPLHLPPGLPVNSAEIGAVLAFGLQCFRGSHNSNSIIGVGRSAE